MSTSRTELVHRFPGVEFLGSQNARGTIGRMVHIEAGATIDLTTSITIEGTCHIGPEAKVKSSTIEHSRVNGTVSSSTIIHSSILRDATVIGSTPEHSRIHEEARVVDSELQHSHIYKRAEVAKLNAVHSSVFDGANVIDSTLTHSTVRANADVRECTLTYQTVESGTQLENATRGNTGSSASRSNNITASGNDVAHIGNTYRNGALVGAEETQGAGPEISFGDLRITESGRGGFLDDIFGDSSSGTAGPRIHYGNVYRRAGRTLGPSTTHPTTSTAAAPQNRLPPAMTINRDEEFTEEAPEYLCDKIITQELIHEAIIMPSGYTYDREVIEKQINNQGKDPVTRERLGHGDLRPNRALQGQIDEWKTKHKKIEGTVT